MKKNNKSNKIDFSGGILTKGLGKTNVETVSIRLPNPVLNKIKQTASEAGVTSQDIIKIWLAERVKQETK